METNINFDGLKRAIKRVPEELHTENLIGTVTEVSAMFSEEYEQEMKKQHPDWYKEEA